MNTKKFLYFITIFCLLTAVASALAYEMGSSSYRIRSSSLNVGGLPQESTSYLMEETIGEVGTGEMASASYKLKAGYQELQEIYISLTVPTSNLAIDQPGNMSLSVNTVTNASGGALWNVKTDDPAGYTLSLKTDNTNCLVAAATGEAFTDYSEATSGTPETWNVNENQYQFGFSAYGDDAPDGTWGTGSSCITPSSNNLKYRGFTSTTAIQVASSNARTGTSGTDTAFCGAAQQNNVYAPNGSYIADITGTATAQ